MKTGMSPVLAGLEVASPDMTYAKGRKIYISRDTGDMVLSKMHLPEHPPALNPNDSAEFSLELKGLKPEKALESHHTWCSPYCTKSCGCKGYKDSHENHTRWKTSGWKVQGLDSQWERRMKGAKGT